ncbi:hypothetical protein Tco_0335625, partial [Tanacetum coccineum]
HKDARTGAAAGIEATKGMHLLRDGPTDTGDDESEANEDEYGDVKCLLRGDGDDDDDT